MRLYVCWGIWKLVTADEVVIQGSREIESRAQHNAAAAWAGSAGASPG